MLENAAVLVHNGWMLRWCTLQPQHDETDLTQFLKTERETLFDFFEKMRKLSRPL